MALTDAPPIPATISTDRLAELIDCSPQLIYRRLAEAPDELPVRPIRLGRRLRWPTQLVAQVLGLDPAQVADNAPNGHDGQVTASASGAVADGAHDAG
jgi:hypothetical protein